MSDRLTDLVKLIAGVRRCFWLLATVSDDMIANLGLTASLRAILEHLEEHEPQTVPQIAKEKSVRRQSIQVLVDQLREAGLVNITPNPEHRRSVFVTLTSEGRSKFSQVKKRERAKLRELLRTLEGEELATAARTLNALQTSLRILNKGGDGDAT